MKIIRILAATLAALMIAGLFGCAKKSTDKNGETDAPVGENGEIIAVWSDNTKISEEMFTYFFNAYYRYFIEAYSDSFENMGLDPAKSLSSQRHSDKYTWHQYMVAQVYDQLEDLIILADAAEDAGMKITKEDKKEIDGQLAAYYEYAEAEGMTTEQYIVKAFGEGVTVDIMRSAIELRFLANKYYDKLWSGYEFSEEDCLKHYDENKNNFVHFDCLQITVDPKYVDSLKACTDEESFTEEMRKAITETNFMGDYERFSDYIEDLLLKKRCNRMNYNPNVSLGKWVVKEERKAYDIHTKEESTGMVTVTMVLPTNDPGAVSEILYRDDEPVKNLKYIVFEDSADTEGKVKAETIYKNWQEDPTEARFDELLGEYNGAVANEIVRSQFNDQVNDWIFDSERKAGDTAVIPVSGGAYLVYMLEDGDPSWMVDVKAELREESYQKDLEALLEKYPVNYVTEVLYNIKEVVVVDKATEDSQ